MLHRLSPSLILTLSAALRAALIVFGTFQDAYSDVRYTDIDYDVFTGAAKLAYEGDNPYDRSTYRYTPLLAYLLVPNITVHIAWGKVLFALADIAAALLIWKRVVRKCSEADYPAIQVDSVASLALSAWLFNPYTATISTRGNGDSLVVLQQLLVLILLQHSTSTHSPSITKRGRSTGEEASPATAAVASSFASSAQSYVCTSAAGAVYGLLVHWRVFPVVYGPSLVLFFWSQSRKGPQPFITWFKRCCAFGAAALAVFCGLGVIFYKYYGNVFLHEAFLYHASRHDPRHNFSPHFLFTYLFRFGHAGPDGTPSFPDVPLALNPGAMAPLCMAAALLATSVAYWEDLDMSWLLCSIVFVAFNKVSTAQYFVWYLGILPVVIPHLLPAWGAIQWGCVGIWIATQLLWLSQAYRLEFLGEPVFLNVWGVGLCLMAAHIVVYWALVSTHTKSKHSFLKKAA